MNWKGLTLFLLLPLSAPAADIQHVEIKYAEDRFQIDMDVIIHAPPKAVFLAMSNYEELTLVNPAVEKSQITKTFSSTKHLVNTTTKICVLWICKYIKQQQVMRKTPFTKIQATIAPGSKDFKSGEASWEFTPHIQGTRLIFKSDLEPNFWVPPLIGPWAISNMLEAQAIATSNGLERRANHQ